MKQKYLDEIHRRVNGQEGKVFYIHPFLVFAGGVSMFVLAFLLTTWTFQKVQVYVQGPPDISEDR